MIEHLNTRPPISVSSESFVIQGAFQCTAGVFLIFQDLFLEWNVSALLFPEVVGKFFRPGEEPGHDLFKIYYFCITDQNIEF